MGSLFLQQSNKIKKKRRTQDCKQRWRFPLPFHPWVHFTFFAAEEKEQNILPIFCWSLFSCWSPLAVLKSWLCRECLMQVPLFLVPFSPSPPNCDRTQPESSVIHVTAIGGPSTGLLPAKGAEGWDRQSPLGGL